MADVDFLHFTNQHRVPAGISGRDVCFLQLADNSGPGHSRRPGLGARLFRRSTRRPTFPTRLRRRAEVSLRGIRAAELSPPDDSRSEQRTPRTHRLQAILIQRTPTGFCRIDEPENYFPHGPAGKEIYPGNAGAR